MEEEMSLVMLNERIHEQNKTKQNKTKQNKTGSDLSQTTTPWPVDSPF